ncbi:transposase family protein [Streptomyces sp. NPDC090032]|uniref:transposase family protein n=1 Tax=unclassified Streptomyces TaxID=2593676 RepID=UPI00371CDAC7
MVTARTRDVAVPCPVCRTPAVRVHEYHHRTVRDVPADGRPVVVHLRVRRLVCPVLGCSQQTFREQIPGLLKRPHQPPPTAAAPATPPPTSPRNGAPRCPTASCTTSRSQAPPFTPRTPRRVAPPSAPSSATPTPGLRSTPPPPPSAQARR